MSLKYRIAVIIFLLEAVMMAFVLGITLTEYRDSSREQAHKNEEVLMQLLADLSRIALFTGEYDELQPYIEHVIDDPRVEQVTLLDDRGTVVVSSDVADVGKPFLPDGSDADEYWLHKPIRNAAGQLGTLAIQISDKPLLAANQRVLDKGIQVALLGMIIIAIIGVFIGFLLTRRLDRLKDAAQRLADGELGVRVDVRGRDEVAILGQAFERMARSIEGTVQDLHRSREDLQTAHADLERRIELRTRELAVARDQALEASRAKSMFVANMSHELRTPLNAIIGYGEMLEEEAQATDNVEFARDLKKITGAGVHLLNLINDILDLSKVEAGKMELLPERFPIGKLVAEVAMTVQPLVEKNDNRFTIECRDDIGDMYADQTKLKQVLINLIGNAAKFTSHGDITLSVETLDRHDEQWIHFHIRDTGIGMSREQLDRLFTEFSQADASTTRRFGGTGLGLAISRRFTNLMGGDISVHSEEGKGAVFSVRLPLETAADIPYAPPESDVLGLGIAPRVRQAVPVAQERRRAVPRILIVDDDSAVVDILYRHLITQGFDVYIASSGHEGLLMAKQLEPDLIALDVAMPGIDGWTLLNQVRTDSHFTDLPVLAITREASEEMALELGASSFLHKPLDLEELVETITRELRRPEE